MQVANFDKEEQYGDSSHIMNESMRTLGVDIINRLQAANYDEGDIKILLKNIQKQFNRVDSQYLHAVFFPEFSEPSRIPTMFSQPSSLFTHKFDITLSTGQNGNGWISYLPQDIYFHSLWTSPLTTNDVVQTTWDGVKQTIAAPQYTGNAAQYLAPAKYWTKSDTRYISNNFSQVRLVGAVMKVCYIGNSEQDSGRIWGSHVMSSTPFMISDQVVTDGFYAAKGQAKRGLRLVYIPKDDNDLNYYGADITAIDADLVEAQRYSNDSTNSYYDEMLDNWIANNGRVLPWEYAYGPKQGLLAYTTDSFTHGVPKFYMQNLHMHKNQLQADERDTGLFTVIDVNEEAETLHEVAQNESLVDYLGKGAGRCATNYPQQLVCIWRGMEGNKDWLYLECEAHFEGIPRTVIRDIVSVKRQKYNEAALKTVKNKDLIQPLVAQQAADLTPISVMKSKSMLDTVSERIANGMSNFSNLAGVFEGIYKGDISQTLSSGSKLMQGGTQGGLLGNPYGGNIENQTPFFDFGIFGK